MFSRTRRLVRRGASLLRARTLLIAAGLSLAAVACGGGSEVSRTESPTPAPASGPGTITVNSSAISGQQGKLLLLYAEADGKPGYIAQACIQITSNSFKAAETTLIDFKQGDSPCTGSPAQTRFPEGSYTITAGIIQPPAQSPEKKITQPVRVAGNAKVSLDGSALSK